jgi:hypothetical protein
LIARRGILTVISGLATITAIAADIRETRAGIDSQFTDLRRSNPNLVVPPPTDPRSRPLVRAAAPGARAPRSRVRGQEQSIQGKANSRTGSDKAQKTRTHVTPALFAGAPAPPPAPAAGAAGATPPPPSACQARLTPDIALAHALPSITGPGSCNAEDVVRLEAVVLEDGEHVTLAPSATLRCPMAEAVARWIRENVAPAAATTLGSPARTIATAGSYECRERDRVPGAKLSEHSRANALDLRGLILADGTKVDLTDKVASKEFREVIRQSACNTFRTVLGPGSDDWHASNIHLDLIERKGNYRICQWDVLALPEVGSTLSPERPHGPEIAK